MDMITALKNETNYAITENGAVTHKSTLNDVLDLFAMGGSYRNRTDDDCIKLFQNAFYTNSPLALKCLFYLRDRAEGQGERRFFRVCFNWLAKVEPEMARRNLQYAPMFGRWDDLYCLVGTPLETDMFTFMKEQLAKDLVSVQKENGAVSLLGKWLKSCNASSKETKHLGTITRTAFGMNEKQYRKTLSVLRERIKVVEKLMSENRFDEIEFDKIPSRAGLIYRNAFARHDITKDKYKAFAQDKTTKVNASVLYPQDIAASALKYGMQRKEYDDPERMILQKYWDNLPDYYNGREENGIAVVDVSGSMSGTPMEAAISLGAYIAEKAGTASEFANHFITFSKSPVLVKFRGVDIVEKFKNCHDADWGMNTNLSAVFELLLSTAIANEIPQEKMPTRLYIFSDMEFDQAITELPCSYGNLNAESYKAQNTLIEGIANRWRQFGYEIPEIVFWNLDARQNNIPAMDGKFSYISGFSPVMIEQVLSGKTGIDLMLDKLNSERYACIH